MNKNQNTAQAKKSLHFHISHKTMRFTVALCAAAMLVGGVAYAATPEAETIFTNDIRTSYERVETAEQPDITPLMRETGISITSIGREVTYLAKQDHIPMGWPVESRIVSTEFNPTADKSISDGRKHEGIDISTKSQIIPIYATASGEVVTANFRSDYGYQVIIDHGNGFTTLYAHCNELLVNAGDVVEKGDVIATTGSTGWSSGIHCHYEIMLNGEYQNPRDYF